MDEADLFMKKWKSHIAVHSFIPLELHASLKLHRNAMVEIESKDSKV